MSLMSKVTAVVCNPVNCFPNRAELFWFFFYIVEVVLYVLTVLVAV